MNIAHPTLKSTTTLALMLLLALVGCQRGPQFIHHPRPEWMVDFDPFADAGCPPDSNGLRICEPDSALGALGCDRIQEPSSLLGSLNPALPIAVCVVEPNRTPDDPTVAQLEMMEKESYLYARGCLLRSYARYVLHRDSEFRLVSTIEELAQWFAPIDSPDEAFSYAIAATGLSARFGQEHDPKMAYATDRIEDSHAVAEQDGYLVYLYTYRFCGCGPHPTSVVELRVARSGEIEALSRQEVFRDPEEDNLCID